MKRRTRLIEERSCPCGQFDLHKETTCSGPSYRIVKVDYSAAVAVFRSPTTGLLEVEQWKVRNAVDVALGLGQNVRGPYYRYGDGGKG